MFGDELQTNGVFERQMLRTMFGHVQNNGVWRQRINNDLAQLCSEPIEELKLEEYSGQGSMPEGNSAKMVFVFSDTRKRRGS